MVESEEKNIFALLKCIGEFIFHVDCKDEECEELQEKAKECLAELEKRMQNFLELHDQQVVSLTGHRICPGEKPQIPEG
jgi:hypothetical protein